MKLDLTSLLVEVSGDDVLGDVEARLREVDRTLAVDDAALGATVRDWIDRGAPGARDLWLDPVDQILAGFEATLRDGRTLAIRPAPRRAVGPDLAALLLGCGGRFAKLTRAWLRIHDKGARLPVSPFTYPREPEVTDEERRILDAIAREL
jgi:alkyldihydroxyacetonephosphate synthase